MRLGHWPLRLWLLIALLVACVLSAINATNYADFRLEMVPIPPVVIFLYWLERRRRPLSDLSCSLIFVFLLLHLLGAHYLYSHVPYDDWSESLFGVRISDLLGTQRNHYDRLVHFLCGVLLTLPMVEVIERLMPLHGRWAIVVAVSFVAFMSKTYELAEWAISLVMAPEAAEAYNGQQGDIFDAHKDMALALGASMMTAIVIAAVRRPESSAAEPGDTRRSPDARNPVRG